MANLNGQPSLCSFPLPDIKKIVEGVKDTQKKTMPHEQIQMFTVHI